jgi:cyclopropane fatty-acyl-phospholipid synthase-like methyltransferase
MKPHLRDIYDGFAETYEASRGQFDMSGILGPFFGGLAKPKGRLLDLGCGAGEPFPRFFLDRGWEVYGVDFSKKMLELAVRYAPEMKLIHADMLDVEFEPDHFDAITCIYSLFHVPRARHPELFARFRQWLRPGGKILFTYAAKEYTGEDEFEGFREFMGQNLFYSHTSPAKLRAAIEQAGLHVEAIDLREIGGESFLWVTAHKSAAEPRP